MTSVQQPRWVRQAAPALLSILLAACGGGGGGGGDPGASGTVTQTAAYTGPIAGLGSIVVNGVRFETVGVEVEDSDDIYGSTGFRSPLALGMTVALGGSVNESTRVGRPSRIRVLGGARGYLSATPGPLATGLATVNGQSVVLDANTVFAGSSARGPVGTSADLQAGDAVEIYGLTQANGDFLATRVVVVASLTADHQLAIRGTVVSSPATSPATSDYFIRTSSSDIVQVACSGACELKPSGVVLGANAPVRVLASSAASLSGGVLVASRIQSMSLQDVTRFAGVASSYAEIKGYTQQVGSDWYVGGTRVTGYAFSGAGQFVEVRGVWSGNALQVSRVELESERRVSGGVYRNEFYGAVASKSGSTFSLQGVTVEAANAYFSGGSLATLADGDYVEVKGSLSNGVVQAIQVEIKRANGADDDDGDHGFPGGRFEVYGTVSGWTGLAAPFTLTTRHGSYVALAANALLERGTAPVNGSMIEAKGYLDASQRFVITRLELKGPGFSDD